MNRVCRIHFAHAGYVFMMSPVDNKQAGQRIESGRSSLDEDGL